MISPALEKKFVGYPFGSKVPAKIKMLRTVKSTPSMFPAPGEVVRLAVAGSVLPVYTNSYGAVSAILSDNIRLGVRPGDFEVVEWHADHK